MPTLLIKGRQMNPDTRVAVCCYSGDAPQVHEMMNLYRHHGRPVTILSPAEPETAKVNFLYPGVDCRFGGKQCYIGWDGVERMKAHLRILLEYPENFFLIHDADSVMLTPEIPAYCYAEPDVLWSNLIPNGTVAQQPGFAPDMPHIAFHPPWFLSRNVIERLLAIGDEVQPNEFLPFIDYWMVEAAVRGGIPYKSFVGCCSMPISSHEPSRIAAINAARAGTLTVVHSVKGRKHVQPLVDARNEFLGIGKAGMNENTRVAICCYEGDKHQLYLPGYLQHGCPVTILSPDDSRAIVDLPGVDCRFGGKRAYIGQDSLDRQAEHLRILLEYPEDFFLIHDSDSILLDAKIPDYLYAEPDFVWSNQVNDEIPEHQPYMPEGCPKVAFQPPYFLSRKTIERMLAVKDDPRCVANACMPFIDFYMVQLTYVAGLPWRRFNDCISCQITADPHKPAGEITAKLRDHYGSGFKLATLAVSEGGANILHSVKDPNAAKFFMELRQNFLAGNPHAAPQFNPAPTVGGDRSRNRGQQLAALRRQQQNSGLKA
jgi:hypothetical protein